MIFGFMFLVVLGKEVYWRVVDLLVVGGGLVVLLVLGVVCIGGEIIVW